MDLLLGKGPEGYQQQGREGYRARVCTHQGAQDALRAHLREYKDVLPLDYKRRLDHEGVQLDQRVLGRDREPGQVQKGQAKHFRAIRRSELHGDEVDGRRRNRHEKWKAGRRQQQVRAERCIRCST